MTIPHSVSIRTYSTYIQCVATFHVHTDDCAMQYELRTADHHHRPLPPLHSGLYSVCGRLLLRLFVFILDVIRCKFTYRLVFPGKDWNSDCAILSVCFTQQFHISAVEANKNNALYTFNKWLATADKKISVMCAVQQRAAEQMGMGGKVGLAALKMELADTKNWGPDTEILQYKLALVFGRSRASSAWCQSAEGQKKVKTHEREKENIFIVAGCCVQSVCVGVSVWRVCHYVRPWHILNGMDWYFGFLFLCLSRVYLIFLFLFFERCADRLTLDEWDMAKVWWQFSCICNGIGLGIGVTRGIHIWWMRLLGWNLFFGRNIRAVFVAVVRLIALFGE